MARSSRNSGKEWTAREVRALREAARGAKPTRNIAQELGRTVGAVYQKAHEERISFRRARRALRKRRK